MGNSDHWETIDVDHTTIVFETIFEFCYIITHEETVPDTDD